jgi:alpha-galactosidase
LDFNLYSSVGCNRNDHGPGDGLYEHHHGYYRTIEQVHARYPEVVLENCSSGGLRIDLGMLCHTDMTFLSDPDWPVHDLQMFWGATQMLAPDACLRWSFCEWLGEGQPAQQNFDPRDPSLTRCLLDYYTRISMLGLYGLSQNLVTAPDWVM